jgi:hypothetical protein
MERRDRSRSRAIATVALGLILLAGAGSSTPVSAAPGAAGSVSRSGSCSLSSTWKLVVKKNGGGLDVKFSVTGGPARHTWNVFLDDDGSGFFAGSRKAGKAGSVSVIASTANTPGTDTIGAAASDRATGETCSGRASL